MRKSEPIPFSARLGATQALNVAAILLVALLIWIALEIFDTVRGNEGVAVDKGCSLAMAMAPMMEERTPAQLTGYFNTIASSQHLDYIQWVSADGKVQASNSLSAAARVPEALEPARLHELEESFKLNRRPTTVYWNEGGGADIFMAVSVKPEVPTEKIAENFNQLRIGVKFSALAHENVLPVVYRILLFSLLTAIVLVVRSKALLGMLLAPLSELEKGLKAMENGNYDYQVPDFSTHEMTRLARAFNTANGSLRTVFKQVQELATHDALTQLPNRRLLATRIANEAARSRRYGYPFGLLIMDLDKFKSINDQYGHPAGDEVLKTVAKVIQTNVRETDIAARIGGEEFAVLLSETLQANVMAIAEKLRLAVAECELPERAGLPAGHRITISIGVACSAGRFVTPEALTAAADAALYQSKADGRNRITVAPMQAGRTDFIRAVKEKKSHDKAKN